MNTRFAALLAGGLMLPVLLACQPATQAPPSGLAGYSASTLEGERVTLASLRGEAVLLNIWATWCGPCRQEIPFLAELSNTQASDGLRVIGVSIDAAKDREKVLTSARELGITYPVWLDPEEAIGGLLRTTGMPVSALIDRQGVLRWTHTGVLKQSTPGFAEALERVLERNQAS